MVKWLLSGLAVGLLTQVAVADSPPTATFWMDRLAATAHAPESQQAFDALAALGPAALPELARGLRYADPHVRFQALLLAGRLDVKNSERTEALVLALQDTDERISEAAVALLGKVGPPAVQALLPSLEHCRPEVRANAIRVIGELDPEAALPELARAAGDADEWNAQAALDVLAKLGPRARPVVPSLLRLAYQKNWRLAVTKVLAATGDPRARAVVPLLLDDLAASVKELLKKEEKPGKAFDEEVILVGGFPNPAAAMGIYAPLPSYSAPSAPLDGLASLGPLAADAVPQVMALLGDNKLKPLHGKALQTLDRLQVDLRPFVPWLVAMGKQANVAGLTEVQELFLRFGLTDPACRAILLKQLLEDDSAPLRMTAAKSLLTLRPTDHRFLPHLTATLEKTKDEDVQRVLARALAKLGPVGVPALRELLSRVEDAPRDAALTELLRLTPGDRELARLLFFRLGEDLGEERKGFASDAGLLLGHAGMATAVSFLHDLDPRVRRGAVYWLSDTRLDPKVRLVALRAAIADPSPKVKAAAALGLGRLGVRAIPAIPDLIKLLEDVDEDVASAAVDALEAIGPAVHPAAAAILQAERKHQGPPNGNLVGLLASFGPAAFPILERGLSDPSPRVRSLAAAALRLVGYKSIAPTLRPLLNDNDSFVRREAALTLALLMPGDAACLPTLSEMLDFGREIDAAEAVKHLGPTGRPLMKQLQWLFFEHEDFLGNDCLLDALVALGPDALPGFRAGLHHANPIVRVGSMTGLVRIPHPDRVKTLLSVLNAQARDEMDRAFAATQLGNLGPQAEAAIPALWRAVREDKASVRRPAAVALAKIGGQNHKTVILLISLLWEEGDTDFMRGLRRVGLQVSNQHSPPDCFEALLLASDPVTLSLVLCRLAADHPRTAVGSRAAAELVNRGPANLPYVRWLLRHPDSVVRQTAVAALAQGKGDRGETEATFIAVVKYEPIAIVRNAAIGALAERQTAPELVLPFLRERFLASIGPEQRGAEIEDALLLAKFQPQANLRLRGLRAKGGLEFFEDRHYPRSDISIAEYGPAAVPVLMPFLDDPRPAVRLAAIQNLAAIGPAAKGALSALHRLVERETDFVMQSHLRDALDAIVPVPPWGK